jgi:UDP-N-acetylmuramyl-tripeptide synthetase
MSIRQRSRRPTIETTLPLGQDWGAVSGRVKRLTTDSRDVVPGAAFIAMPGQITDGHAHIPEAVRNGAAVVFHETDRPLGLDPAAHPGVSFVAVTDTRAFGAAAAPAFYDFPSRRMKVTAITGTNGKSTCSLLLEALARGLGKKTGVINTFGVRYAGRSFKLTNMVPEPVRLQTLLFDMAEAGVDMLVLEVTSQALAAGRLAGMDLDAAILTNVTRDHLDAHGTMEAYLEAKLSLFELLSRSEKPGRAASLWRGCWSFAHVAERLAGWGLAPLLHDAASAEVAGPPAGAGAPPADDPDLLWAGRLVPGPDGTSFDLHRQGRMLPCRTALLGRFNVLNILAVLGSEPEFLDAVLSGDTDSREVLQTVLRDIRVPGRLQPVPNSLGATILVDYAHTEDGLAQVLSSLRGLPHGRIITVFGCGGDRDRGKRPRMGAVATELSDVVIVTSDNPRTEEPRAIIREIEAGIADSGRHLVVEDRAEAIAAAVDILREGDILLVAGKGHEETQVVGVDEVPFSDVEVVRRHLAAKGWDAG